MKKGFCIRYAMLLSATLSLASCQDNDHPNTSTGDSAKTSTDTLTVKPVGLVEQRLGATDFYLSLPPPALPSKPPMRPTF
jgi:hypothetical protein